MQCRLYILIIIFIMLLHILNGCSNMSVSGGGVEAGNSRVAGILFEPDGTPAEESVVQLVPTEYIGIPGNAHADFQVDTTDGLGRYVLDNISAGTYTLQIKQLSSLKRAIIRNVTVENSRTTNVAGDTVRDAGNLRIILPDSIRNAGGIIAIPGTTCSIQFDSSTASGNIVYIDSLPEGIIPSIVYMKNATPAMSSQSIVNNISIISRDTVSASALPGKRLSVKPGGDVQTAINALLPGDTLYVAGGIYRMSGLLVSVSGNSAQSVLISAVPGDTPVFRDPEATDNCINISDASYVTLQGIEIDSLQPDIDAIKFIDNSKCDHITIRNCSIHNTLGNGINAVGGHNKITLIHNHIHHLNGEAPTAIRIGNTSGAAPNNWVIDNNWIHDIGDSVLAIGDGISLRAGCYSMLVRDNVIYRCGEAGIITYGIGGSNSGGTMSSIIEANAIWNTVEGVGAYRDAIVRNNIVFNCQIPVNSYGNSGPQVGFVSIYNNTFYSGDSLFLTDWDSTDVFANNAVFKIDGIVTSGGSIYNNTHETAGPGFLVGNPSIDLRNPSALDFYPASGSSLIGAGSKTLFSLIDFNTTRRDKDPDIGAYEYMNSTNPGWAIVEGFKKP